MRSRLRTSGVYSLSAIDLFASAMGAFLIITIILMPDYQKEVRLEGHLAYIESLAAESATLMEETDRVASDVETDLAAERRRALELQAERDILDAELQSILAQLRQARRIPPPEEVPVVEEPVNNRVTFRFLGLKTDATRILFLVDMNKYLAEHESLVQRTVIRALDSLGEGYEFAILGFKQLDTGVQYYRWPAEGNLAVMSSANRSRARRFIAGLSGKFSGSSPLYAALKRRFGYRQMPSFCSATACPTQRSIRTCRLRAWPRKSRSSIIVGQRSTRSPSGTISSIAAPWSSWSDWLPPTRATSWPWRND